MMPFSTEATPSPNDDVAIKAATYVSATARPSEGIYAMLRRYQLPTTPELLGAFSDLNADRLRRSNELLKGVRYHMPIRVVEYNGRNIRSTLNLPFDAALRIQRYNEALKRKGIKRTLYKQDGQLWVPFHELPPSEKTSSIDVELAETTSRTPAAREGAVEVRGRTYGMYPIFGEDYARVDYKSATLDGCVYYLVSGHGGPDPGAQSRYGRYTLSEDEYAYDVTLRLARSLIEHGAIVYVIVRDNDGIRDMEILPSDRDEHYQGNVSLPLNQKRRLQMRADRINEYYERHKSSARLQRALMIHVDADHHRYPTPMDVYFFHHASSNTGKQLGKILQDTFEAKYQEHQPGRDYRGPVKARNLFMLRETLPPAILVELGNIRNQRDRQRILKVNNRQALANWFTEGLIREACQYR